MLMLVILISHSKGGKLKNNDYSVLMNDREESGAWLLLVTVYVYYNG